jgi:sugar/nucleoside kinase (ribokinase family)
MLQFDLVGIGNPVYDIIITPEMTTAGRTLSGCSTNACLAAKRLGMKRVGMVGCVGRDFAERFSHEMSDYGIEVSIDATGAETGGFRLVYDDKGNRTLDVLGVAGKITEKTFPDDFLKSKFFLIGPILGELDLKLIEFLRSSSSSVLFLDPQGLIRLIGEDGRIVHRCDNDQFKKIVGLVDFVKPNEPESETITGQRDPIRALKDICNLGARVPIVTLAERGSLLLNDDHLYRIPTYPTRAIDPTGAGDAYAGSFISEFARTEDIVESALFASAAASLMVEQIGPDFKMNRQTVLYRKGVIRDKLVAETVT